jgi:hypothetical protein
MRRAARSRRVRATRRHRPGCVILAVLDLDGSCGPSVRDDLLARLGRDGEAAAEFCRAAALTNGQAEDGNRFVLDVMALEADPQLSAGAQFGGIRVDDLRPPPRAFGQFGDAQDRAAGFPGGIGFAVGNGPADKGCVG